MRVLVLRPEGSENDIDGQMIADILEEIGINPSDAEIFFGDTSAGVADMQDTPPQEVADDDEFSFEAFAKAIYEMTGIELTQAEAEEDMVALHDPVYLQTALDHVIVTMTDHAEMQKKEIAELKLNQASMRTIGFATALALGGGLNFNKLAPHDQADMLKRAEHMLATYVDG